MAAEGDAKRKGTALLAVMNENCTSCAGSPICEVHCPVDDCIVPDPDFQESQEELLEKYELLHG